MLFAQKRYRGRLLGVALCLLALLTGCSPPGNGTSQPAPTTAKESPSAPRETEVVAHRGGLPENTLSAFKKALSNPEVGAIELDVQVSQDGELFIMHDKTVDRTTSGKGAVKDLTAAQMRELKTPKGGTEAVPTLDEVLALVAAAPGKRVLVEIKAPVPDETPAKVLAALEKHGLAGRSVVISFDRPLVEAIRKLSPSQATGFLSKQFNQTVLSYPGEYLMITSTAITRERVEQAHKAGKKLYVWTVDDSLAMEGHLLMGVDGIISNQYELLIKTKQGLKR